MRANQWQVIEIDQSSRPGLQRPVAFARCRNADFQIVGDSTSGVRPDRVQPCLRLAAWRTCVQRLAFVHNPVTPREPVVAYFNDSAHCDGGWHLS
jgi:hypothetical protein